MALILTNGPRQANLVLIAYASSEGSGEPAHSRSLARTFAAHSYKQWIKRNRLTESQIPGPSEWLGMRSWNLSWRNARRHKFAWRGSNRGSTCFFGNNYDYCTSSSFVEKTFETIYCVLLRFRRLPKWKYSVFPDTNRNTIDPVASNLFGMVILLIIKSKFQNIINPWKLERRTIKWVVQDICRLVYNVNLPIYWYLNSIAYTTFLLKWSHRPIGWSPAPTPHPFLFGNTFQYSMNLAVLLIVK